MKRKHPVIPANAGIPLLLSFFRIAGAERQRDSRVRGNDEGKRLPSEWTQWEPAPLPHRYGRIALAPSTFNSCPVVKLDASEASHRQASATSSTLPMRPIGWIAANSA